MLENIQRTNMRQSAINPLNDSKIQEISNKENSYLLLDKRVLHLNDRLSFSLFFYSKPKNMELLLQDGNKINERLLQKIKKIKNIYVLKSDKLLYEDFLEKYLKNILKDKTLSMDDRAAVIYNSNKDLTLSLFENPNALENLQHTQNIVTPILQTILYNHDTISSYIKILEYDYYTHTHSLNVSIYSITLGLELGLKEGELSLLGQSALLHDLGKSKVAHDIVNKDGKLSKEEFESIKAHSSFGYDIAVHIGIKDKEILDGIRYHHEKLNGSGYPDHLKDSEITLFPRIIGVCDVFDALTTRRSYKEAMSSFEALSIMKKEMQTHLDMSILTKFIKVLHRRS